MFTRMMAQGIVTIIYTLEFAGLLVAALPRYKQKYYVPVKMFHHVSLASIRKKQIKNPICARRKTIMPASICLRLLLIWYSPIKRSPTAHRTNGTSII